MKKYHYTIIAQCAYYLELKAAIHQPQYFPYPGFFHKLSLADVFVVMDNTQYDKRFTNRNKIISTYGWTWITVPINKEHKFLPNRLVEINNDSSWKEIHAKKILTAYANAKFFHLYKDYIKSLYLRDWKYLFDLDFETLKQTVQWLGLKIRIIQESELTVMGKATERLISICKAVGADTYISGRGGGNYIDEKLFEKNDLRLEYQNYIPQRYAQNLSKSFIPDLSILDMLVNVGPDSLKLMTNGSQSDNPKDELIKNFSPS